MVKSSQAIVFVHGIWMSPWFMRYLGRRCRHIGYQIFYFSYPTVSGEFNQSVDAFARWLNAIESDVVHIVAHSLGSLLVLDYLQRYHSGKLGRVILLAPPAHGSRVAAQFSRFWLGRKLLGSSKQALTTDRSQRNIEAQIGVIAGSVGIGLGRFIAPMSSGTDGAVAIEETRLSAAQDWISLPVSHSGMLLSAQVANQIDQFLTDGCFQHNLF